MRMVSSSWKRIGCNCLQNACRKLEPAYILYVWMDVENQEQNHGTEMQLVILQPGIISCSKDDTDGEPENKDQTQYYSATASYSFSRQHRSQCMVS